MAKEGNPDAIAFPRAKVENGEYDFSFSGLKSAVINYKHNMDQRGEEIIPEHVAKGFQDSVVEVLTTKAVRAAKQYKVKQVIAAGGVSANKGLRSSLEKAFEAESIPLYVPPLNLCTDNAAMIGAAAAFMFNAGKRGNLEMNGKPGLELVSDCVSRR